jgi:uncharacterized membrane protein
MSHEHDESTDEPQVLVGVSFDDVFRAQEFLTEATRMAAQGRLKLRDAVTIIKNEQGRSVVHETIDPSPGRTAFTGALWASLLGLIIGGPVGWVAGAALGAGAGALTAKVVDLGISDEWEHWFRETVQPGNAMVALLVTDLDRDALVAEAARFTGARLVYANLDDATIARIAEALGTDVPQLGEPEPRDDVSAEPRE